MPVPQEEGVVVNEILQDPMFFYAIAFTLFAGLAFVYGRKPVVGWLDSEIAKIQTELDHARHLRAEAEAALESCKAKQAEAEADAKAILSRAEHQIEAMRLQAKNDLAATLKRHEQLAAERIRLAEAEAIALVRRAAVERAMGLAREKLASSLSDSDSARLIDQAISDIPALASDQAKAA